MYKLKAFSLANYMRAAETLPPERRRATFRHIVRLEHIVEVARFPHEANGDRYILIANLISTRILGRARHSMMKKPAGCPYVAGRFDQESSPRRRSSSG